MYGFLGINCSLTRSLDGIGVPSGQRDSVFVIKSFMDNHDDICEGPCHRSSAATYDSSIIYSICLKKSSYLFPGRPGLR